MRRYVRHASTKRTCSPYRIFTIAPRLTFLPKLDVMASCVPVYVVDDDPDMLESTQFLLGSFKLNARTFPDPLAFLKALPKLEPGCVLTDLSMPTMTGIQLHEALLARGIDWPVVVMSGNSDFQTHRHMLGDSVVGFVEKPFSVERLLEVLHDAFDVFNGKPRLGLARS